jgi:putative hemolysin
MTITTLLMLTVGIVAWLTAAATAVRSVSRIWLRHWVEQQLSGSGAAALCLERRTACCWRRAPVWR